MSVPPGDELVNRQVLTQGAVVTAFVAVTVLAFTGSYVGALRDPSPHGVPIAIAGPRAMAQALGRSGALKPSTVPTRAAAIRSIDVRSVYAAVIVSPTGVEVLLASAAGQAVAEILQQLLPTAIRDIAGPSTPIRISDIKPLPNSDPRGTSGFYLVVALALAGYMGAAFLAGAFGVKPVGRQIRARIGAIATLALVVSSLGIAIVHAIGPLAGHYLPLVGVSMLVVLTVGCVAVAFQSAMGVLGTLISMLIVVVLGNPSSGGPYSYELLPGLWRTVGPYLPTGAGVDLVRNISYFGGNAVGRPLIVMAIWLAVGITLVVVFARLRPHGVAMQRDRVADAGESPAAMTESL
jgi:hypothetical protein